MALITSTATGNFSAGATWTGGVVPTTGDEARAATGHIVNIDVNTTCDTISNAGTGRFTIDNGVTLTADLKSLGGNAVNLLTISGSNNATVVGNVFAGNNGGAALARAISMDSTGTLTITGSVNGVTSVFTVPGSSVAISISAAGNVNITGNVVSQNGGSTLNPVITSTAAANITITGNCEANLAAAISTSSAITLTIVGDITASNQANAVFATSASAVIKCSGNFISSSNGTLPIYAQKFILDTTPTAAKTRYALNGAGTYVDMFTADNSLTQAVPADVRSGTVYADGNLTGTLAVPAAGSVALGVAVDATTGTAVLTPAAVWDALTSGMTTSGSIGARLKNAATVDTTGQSLADALTPAP